MDILKDIDFLSELIRKYQGNSHARKLVSLSFDVEAARSIVRVSESGKYPDKTKLDAAALRWVRSIAVSMQSVVSGDSDEAHTLKELSMRGSL